MKTLAQLLCILALLPALLACPSPNQAQISTTATCTADRIDEKVSVAHVHDGDTLILKDGRKIRILAIDTPELARKQRPAEALAIAARDFLRQHIKPNSIIHLRHDAEKKDRYKRSLSHVFLTSGHNVSQMLLEAGLATTLILPPNTWSAACYQQAQQTARQQKRGLWQLAKYKPTKLAELGPIRSSSQYMLISGTVQKLEQQRKQNHIILQDKQRRLTLIIKDHERQPFQPLLKSIRIGQTLEVHGWVNQKNKRLSVHVRHPSALQIVTP